ncbi:unnamed protein product [Heterobilharzia americana]|nr:unnamed protein product [Heterobilharzia americana]
MSNAKIIYANYHKVNLFFCMHNFLPSSSCHCQPTTDVLPIDISRQPQQQQQISSSLLTPSTTQTAPIVSVYNDSFVTSSMGTSFSLRAYNVNQKSNEEHNLIARYAAQLAAASALNQEFDKLGDFVDSTQTQKQLIAQLQEKNRKILKEIERLRIEQQKQAAFIAAAGSFKHDSFELQDLVSEGAGTLSPTNLVKYVKADNLGTSAPTNLMIAENPRLFADLQALRQRKDELESRMNNLQRSRTDLMLQLEALVRLLSVSSGPTNLQENNTSLPIDPPRTYDSGDICRSGHKSRMDQKLPEYPPRRSTSLCHPSVGRNVPEKFFPTVTPSESRYDVGDGNHQKPSSCDAVRKNVSPLKTVSVAERGGQWNLKFFEDKKHELHSPSSVTSRHSVEIDPQRTSDNLLEKYKDLLYKGANAQPVASKSLKLHSGGRRPYLGAFQTEEKTVLFNHNSTNVIRLSSNHSSHQTNHSDSGSDAYLYSDPELCFTITSMTCPSQSGVSTLQAAVQLSPLPSASTVVSKSSKTSRDLLGCLSDKTVTTTPIVDNYEYAGSHPCSVPPLSYFQDEHVRHRRNNTLSIPATTNL